MTIVGALPFTLQNGTTADATQVMADFNSIKTDVNTNGAASGANSDITSLAGLTTPLSIAQGGSGSAAPGPFVFAGGYRNIARRNGGLEIWQRGAGGAASFAVGASGGSPYTSDGWYVLNGANQACVVSQSAGISNGSQWCAKIIRNNAQTGTGTMAFSFPLDTDELYPMLGQFVRLSFVAKCGANFSPASSIVFGSLYVGTGAPVKRSTGFTGETNPILSATIVSSTATRFQSTSTVIVPTTTRQAEIVFQWTPSGTAGADDSLYIDDVQLEIVPASSGYGASNFERLTFLEQWALCQRHYQKSFTYAVAPAQNVGFVGSITFMAGKAGAGSDFFSLNFPFVMRVAPSITYYNTSNTNAQARDSVAAADCSSTTASNIATGSFFTLTTGNASTAVGNALEVHYTADAGI